MTTDSVPSIHPDQPYFVRRPEEREHPFAMIPNDLIRDPSIDPETKWFISYLLSHIDHWKLYAPYIMKSQCLSKNKVYALIKKAIAAGYLLRESYLDSGKKRYRYQVSRSGIFKKSLLFPQKQDTEKQDTENGDCKEDQSLEKTKRKEEREGAGPPASPPPTRTFFYKRVQIDMDKYNKLCDEFTTGKIQEMMERLDEYADINPKRFNQYRDHATVIRKWIREDSQNPQGRVNRGLELARKLKAWVHTEKDTRIEFEAKGINFGYSPGGGSNFVAYDDPKSAEKIEMNCAKMGIFL